MLLPLQLNNLLEPASGVDGLLADDLQSVTELSTPAIGQIHALLADDLESATELSTPTLVENVDSLLADDLQVVVQFSRPALSDGTVQPTKNKGGRSRRGKRFYVVEVDGQDFVVSTISEAQYLLRQAETLARESAERDATKAELNPAIRLKPPRIAVRTSTGKQTSSVALQREVKRTQGRVAEIYREAQARVATIRREAEKAKQARDEEESIIALLM